MQENTLFDADDAFEKLLDDFLAENSKDLEGDNEGVDTPNRDNRSPFDDDGIEVLNTLVIRHIVVTPWEWSTKVKKPLPRILFMGEGRSNIHLNLNYKTYGEHGDVEVRITRYRNSSLAIIKRIGSHAFKRNSEGELHLEVDVSDLLRTKGAEHSIELGIELFDERNKSISFRTVKIAYLQSSIDLFSYNRIIMGNIANGGNPLAMDTTTPYVQFGESELDALATLFVVNKRVDFDYEELNAKIRLTTPSGRKVVEDAMIHTYDDGATALYTSFRVVSDSGRWQRGTYRVELLIDDEAVASAPMTVGDNRIEGEVDINNMLSMMRAREGNKTPDKERKGTALKQLNAMAGLSDIKAKVKHLGGMAHLAEMRRKAGLPAPDLALHALFKGSSGTGKTTVAKLMGRIYHDMGLLSSGHVVVAERRTLTGRYYDSEARAVEQAIASARGGILFIDEAYMLNVKDDPRDPGHKVLEHLLTALSDKTNRDWMLILAGYTKEMEELMNSNPGLSSRISNVFCFNDYNVDELLNIADIFCREQSYTLTTDARTRLRALIERDYAKRDANFGNGRYVVNLMEQSILPSLAERVARMSKPTAEALQRITAEDIPISDEEVERQKSGEFDNEAIDKALQRLDNLTGQHKVKQAIHNFVTFARHLQAHGERFVGDGILRWNFAGSSGMGKSTVAAILADILRAMGLIHRSDITEVRTSHLYAGSEHHAESVLRQAVERADHGVLLIDNDSSVPFNILNHNGIDPLKMHLREIAEERGKLGAIIIAECRTINHAMADNLARQGIYDYDHTLLFDDLTSEELWEILCRRMERYNAHFDADAEAVMREYIGSLCASRDPKVANARTIKLLSRTIFEQVVLRESREQSKRSTKPRRTKHTIKRSDVEPYRWMPTTKTIGYGAI